MEYTPDTLLFNPSGGISQPDEMDGLSFSSIPNPAENVLKLESNLIQIRGNFSGNAIGCFCFNPRGNESLTDSDLVKKGGTALGKGNPMCVTFVALRKKKELKHNGQLDCTSQDGIVGRHGKKCARCDKQKDCKMYVQGFYIAWLDVPTLCYSNFKGKGCAWMFDLHKKHLKSGLSAVTFDIDTEKATKEIGGKMCAWQEFKLCKVYKTTDVMQKYVNEAKAIIKEYWSFLDVSKKTEVADMADVVDIESPSFDDSPF
jgi:hypothetical protein